MLQWTAESLKQLIFSPSELLYTLTLCILHLPYKTVLMLLSVDDGQSDRGGGAPLPVPAGGGTCQVKLCQSCGSTGRATPGNCQKGQRGKCF